MRDKLVRLRTRYVDNYRVSAGQIAPPQCKPVASTRDVQEPIAFVVAKYQNIEILRLLLRDLS
jgi:hypothetical protein